MLWDVTPIRFMEQQERKSRKDYMASILQLLEGILLSKNEASVESALHGLGHLQLHHPDEVSKIISSYLRKRPDISPTISVYARAAMRGLVQ
jgi:hypothetical protein